MGQFFANSTQLPGFFWNFGFSFFKILLEFWLFAANYIWRTSKKDKISFCAIACQKVMTWPEIVHIFWGHFCLVKNITFKNPHAFLPRCAMAVSYYLSLTDGRLEAAGLVLLMSFLTFIYSVWLFLTLRYFYEFYVFHHSLYLIQVLPL